MDDSFFGFDTSAPVEGISDGKLDGSEEEYDALNDETFGDAINGDWEKEHENLVRGFRDKSSSVKDKEISKADEDENADLELSLSRVKLDDVELVPDDTESRIQLDPSVWANSSRTSNSIGYSSSENFLRQGFPTHHLVDNLRNVQQQQQQQQTPIQQQQNRIFNLPTSSLPTKICTLEDIERNIINQQFAIQQKQQQQQQHLTPHQQQPIISNLNEKSESHQAVPPQQTPRCIRPTSFSPTTQSSNFLNNRPSLPPGFSAPRPNFNLPQTPPQLPLPFPPQQPHRLHSGMSPLPLMGAGPGPSGYARPLAHNLQIALNNFAMHPSFNAVRPLGPHLPSRFPLPPPAIPNTTVLSSNNFNQRLVQEIQQNHPMLLTNRSNFSNPNSFTTENRHHQNNAQHNKNNHKSHNRSNGNVPQDYDEYANLMSTRDKHWLIGIQLSQLNTDTPYIDDYYYTVFKERKAKMSGDSQSKAHKDNQLNHPLTQPKGHAQLVLLSMGKNGTNNRNGQQRERKNSETKPEKDQHQKTFTPLQFENSLGKLQYGSVTAPRKIIDMEIMGTDSSPLLNTTVEISAQRKSKQLLLHIETLYKIVLKLEDLQNPAAIATAVVVKEKLEKEKQQLQEGAASNKDAQESQENSERSSISENFVYELEPKEKLLQKMIPCLNIEKVIGMMSVRKGKILIRRILPHIEDHPIRWNVWIGVFSSLQNVLRKDRDDQEGLLYALYSEFKNQINSVDMENLNKIANSCPLSEKRQNNLFNSKFFTSALIAMILKAESFYQLSNIHDNSGIELEAENQWSNFLINVSACLSKVLQNQIITASIEKDAVDLLIKHFSRFQNLEVEPLLSLLSLEKE